MNLLGRKPFFLLLMILVWAPIPFGSNRPWAWLLLSTLCFALALITLFEFRNHIDVVIDRITQFRSSCLLLLFVALWVTIQSLVLPFNVIDGLSPGQPEVIPLSSSRHFSLSTDPARTGQFALLSWGFFCLYCATLLLLDSPRRIRTTLVVLVTMGVLQASYAALMTLSKLEYSFLVPKQSYLGTATGTFINRNHLAGFLEMSLALGIGLVLADIYRGRKRSLHKLVKDSLDALLSPKFALRVGLAIMVVALLLTRSRMGNIAFFISLPVCAITMMALQRRLHKGAIIFFVSLFVVDIALVGEWFGFDELAERVQSTSLERENRDELALDTIAVFGDNLISGTGAGTYFVNFPAYQTRGVTPYYSHAHNDYLEFASTFGLLGFIPLSLFVLASMANSLRVLAKRRNRLARGLAFGSLMATVSILIHSLSDFNLQIPANALLFIVVLAMGHIAAALPRGKPRSSPL